MSTDALHRSLCYLAGMPAGSQARRDTPLPRYEEIARRYAAAIENGTLAPGDRFPSVRRLAAEEDASVSTILSAIAQLETLGLIEARPRSGHFVRLRARPPRRRPT